MERGPEALSYKCASRGALFAALVGPSRSDICRPFSFAAVLMHGPNLWFLPGVKYSDPESAKKLTNSCTPTSGLLCGSRGNEIHRPRKIHSRIAQQTVFRVISRFHSFCFHRR